MREKLWLAAQFGLTCLLGAIVFLNYPPTDNPKERLLAAVIVGIGGVWTLMFLWTWARYGWSAARSMSFFDRIRG